MSSNRWLLVDIFHPRFELKPVWFLLTGCKWKRSTSWILEHAGTGAEAANPKSCMKRKLQTAAAWNTQRNGTKSTRAMTSISNICKLQQDVHQAFSDLEMAQNLGIRVKDSRCKIRFSGEELVICESSKQET